jgi:hypothetical protein
MNAKIRSIAFLLICATSLPSCATFHNPGPTITLQKAVEDSVKALKYAADAAHTYHGSWGLKPAEVTLTYNISNETDANEALKIGASYPPVTIGGEFGLAKKTQTGNTVVMKFTQGGR